MIDQHHIDELTQICGVGGVISNPGDMHSFVTEWRDKYIGATQMVLMPNTVERLAKAIAYCNKHRIPLVPQGGNTGLVGGGIPGLEGATELLVSTKRLSGHISISKEDATLTCDAGCTIKELQDAAAEVGFLFPLSLASEGSCTAGGVIATNAGGMHVIRYGTVREFLVGVEAILPDGSIINELSPLKKDNTGYRLSPLIAGSEGTLGLITKAAFKLAPAEVSHATAWLAVPSLIAAQALLSKAKSDLSGITSVFEVMHEDALDFVFNHIPGARNPLSEPAKWQVLLEIASHDNNTPVTKRLDSFLESALIEEIITDGVVAQSDQQRHAFWSLRENISEAQKLEGGSIKHDISVPVAAIAAFVEEATNMLETEFPGVRVTPFGHMGDGNLHFNVMQPKNGDRQVFLAQWETMNQRVHDVVVRYGGSISAEHGIGILKRDELARTKADTSLEAMKQIKRALDPNNIMNPRCLF